MVKDLWGILAHPLRLEIIKFLKKHPDSSVAEVASGVGEDKQLVGAHLKVLEREDIVSVKSGTEGDFLKYVKLYRLKNEEQVRLLLDNMISRLYQVKKEF